LLQIAPPFSPSPTWQHFGGIIASLALLRRTLAPDEITQLSQSPEDFSRLEFEEGSKPWPVQTRGQAGYRAPQDPATTPRSKAPFSHPVAVPVPANHQTLEPTSDNRWTFTAGWRMIPAPDIKAGGAAISQPGYNADAWMQATVPGTVLTTMIDRGIYPDPDYGLNNLAIPETLN